MKRRPLHLYRPGNVIALAMVATVGACSVTRANVFDSPPSPASDRAGERAYSDDILPEEILRRGNKDPTAYDLIQRLRPRWLLPRGQNSFTHPGSEYPVVYIDEIRHGTLMTLRQIPPSHIRRVEFIGTADATTRWGTGHRAGVINIVTGR